MGESAIQINYKNRSEAARLLAETLKDYKNDPYTVVVTPKKGVLIGYQVAQKLGLPWDVVMYKKLAHPNDSCRYIGAVSLHGNVFDHHYQNIYREYIADQLRSIQSRLTERYHLYRGKNAPPELRDKRVILADNGITTGETMKTLLAIIRKNKPSSMTVAVPVASPETLPQLEPMADEMICLHKPGQFRGVDSVL